MKYNNPIKCELCGGVNLADDYGNSDKCLNCGWMACSHNEQMEEWHGISYPMLVPLSRARQQYLAGQKFKATFDDFINGLKFCAERLFWHKGLCCSVCLVEDGITLANKFEEKNYKDNDDFRNNAEINGILLSGLWDEVKHPCFMFCGDDSAFDFPPED